MGEAYLGEIKIVGFNFAPKGWALCNGQLLAIDQNQALFSLLGTTSAEMAVPRSRCRTPGTGPPSRGQRGHPRPVRGRGPHTLTIAGDAGHMHVPAARQSNGTAAGSPAGNVWGFADGHPEPRTASSRSSTMAANAVRMAGGGQPHANMQPYLVLTFVIALQGVFPSRELNAKGASWPINSSARSASRRTTSRPGMGALQRAAPADQPEHRSLLAPRHDLRRGRQDHLRPAESAKQRADPARARARPVVL